MANAIPSFNNRLQRIKRSRGRMKNGIVYKVGRDGLVTFHPRRKVTGYYLRSLLLVIAFGFLFKAVMLSNLGPATYDDRVGQLRDGTVFEQAGAWLMQADIVTVRLAGLIDRI